MSITALIIMDGFGINPAHEGNAIYQQGTPNLDALKAKYSFTQIGASGMDVGLPNGQMGNSEVGHLNIGAGRIVYQEFTRISKSIDDGDFFENPAILSAMDAAQSAGGKLHLMGLCSDGGVHSHLEHVYALLKLAKKQGMADKTFVHCFMDGRDVPPSSGKDYIIQLENEMKNIGSGAIATVAGRYWAMDRDKRWDRVQKAYEALMGTGVTAQSAEQAMQQSYDISETDEFVKPTVIEKDGKPVATIDEGDSVIFFNFRPDRTRELTRALIEPDFSDFARIGGYKKVKFVSMTQYDATFTNLEIAFHPQTLDNTLGEYVSGLGKTQLRIAETEKYAHVTFFFNGGVEEPNAGEDRALISSPKVATYDLKPSMSALEVTDEAVKRIQSGKYDMMILNFANCDMVGHTGVMEAAMEAVKTVDGCVQRVVDAVLEMGGNAIITADHGNADQMIDPQTHGPFTAHTTFPVPMILIDPKQPKHSLRTGGRLCDLAPTLLQLMGIPQPKEMTGTSLIEN
ncbi:2,3-bisphosphoglycerate-independent phosphoglycerate mutase [Eubacteriales bacterium OttesenSCG-928-N13]|nr:2,3-bisphosphoglycerate-independent phosphoglycerate mutase [Eubacteriales bacterium OttesenSCG-928-N13]